MRLLLDECVPRPLLGDLTGHDAHHVVDLGWSSKRNGELLNLMVAEHFEVAARHGFAGLEMIAAREKRRVVGSGLDDAGSVTKLRHLRLQPPILLDERTHIRELHERDREHTAAHEAVK